MIRSRKKPDTEGGPLLLATAILERLIQDARRGDKAAAWAAWAGLGPILAGLMGIDDDAWQWRLRRAGVDRPAIESPPPPEMMAPQAGVRRVGPRGAVLDMMGELPPRGRAQVGRGAKWPKLADKQGT